MSTKHIVQYSGSLAVRRVARYVLSYMSLPADKYSSSHGRLFVCSLDHNVCRDLWHACNMQHLQTFVNVYSLFKPPHVCL